MKQGTGMIRSPSFFFLSIQGMKDRKTKEQVYNMEELLQVGVISSTHGIRGEVKVYPTTDDVNRYKELKNVILDTGREQIPLEIQGVKFFKQFAILKFKGIDSINEIEKYKGKSLWITRADALPLGRMSIILQISWI